jgi:diaminopimelate decarboxylase
LGVAYKPDEVAPPIADFVLELRKRVEGRGLHVMLEPGRSIVGPAGVLLTKALYRKNNGGKEFVVVDAAMNDLIRPALYDAYHDILPLRQRGGKLTRMDVVGPVCETGDFLARDREMPDVLPGDVLAVCTAGAYGFAQSSTYNARRRPAEVLVEGDAWRIVRPRETYEDLIRGEE